MLIDFIHFPFLHTLRLDTHLSLYPSVLPTTYYHQQISQDHNFHSNRTVKRPMKSWIYTSSFWGAAAKKKAFPWKTRPLLNSLLERSVHALDIFNLPYTESNSCISTDQSLAVLAGIYIHLKISLGKLMFAISSRISNNKDILIILSKERKVK